MHAPEQLGFGFDQELEEQAVPLPVTEEAVRCFRQLIQEHHAAMLAGDAEAVKAARKKARDLAVKLNGGDACGILAEDGPGKVLARQTAATPGTVPLWGQEGEFDITVGAMPVHIKMDGMFSVGCASAGAYPGFSAHAVDLDRPFLSETGYRSFLGIFAELAPGQTPDAFAQAVCLAHLNHECRGKPKRLDPSYVERLRAEREEQAEGIEPKAL
jgi:hypothetical protein